MLSQTTTPSVFSFHSVNVRAIADETGSPAFVGKDVCLALGYANPNKAMNDHCKGVTKRYPLQTAGGLQQLRVLAEPDVLRLIIGSKLPAAVEFERLVFEEILPAIRRTGRYEPKQRDLPLLEAVPAITPEQESAVFRLLVERFPDPVRRAVVQARITLRLGVQAVSDIPASKIEETCRLIADMATKQEMRAAKCRENGKKGGRPPKAQHLDALPNNQPVTGTVTASEKIRQRRDLSFVGVDTSGKLECWLVNNYRSGSLVEDLGLGGKLFREVIELAKTDEREAYRAMHFALGGDATFWQPNGGIEWGFARALASAAVIGLRVMRSSGEAYNPEG